MAQTNKTASWNGQAKNPQPAWLEILSFAVLGQALPPPPNHVKPRMPGTPVSVVRMTAVYTQTKCLKA